MRLALFDIDGTLILTGGAGMRAFYRALKQVFSVEVASEVIRPDGKTDPLIAREMLRHFDRESLWNEQSGRELFGCYIGCLDEEMARAAAGEAIRVLPGVKALLDALASNLQFALGLVTGNVEPGARIKLAHAGLHHYFSFGGYGSDSEDRTALIRIGIARGTRLVAPEPVRASFVIGDTPLDITHGRAAGACVIAVASARYSMADLAAWSPDLLVPDLTATAQIVSFMETWPGKQCRVFTGES